MENSGLLTKWIWLSMAFGAGCRSSDALTDEYGCDVERIYSLGREDYLRVCGVASVADRLSDKALDQAEEIRGWCAQNGVGLMTPDMPLYPLRLKKISARPNLLYYLGTPIALDDEAAVAMVGTRSMTEYGSRSAYTIAHELARCGAVIVSGMALGVDGVSHRGALDGGGYTVAVLGCGIENAYPPQHLELRDEIARKGLVLTEYPPFSPPAGQHFPVRNRIISGLSLGTLVIEGSMKSGSMITARAALQQGRDLYALPGKIGEQSSEGPNYLLSNGARIATKASDILENYVFLFPKKLNVSRASFRESKKQEQRRKPFSELFSRRSKRDKPSGASGEPKSDDGDVPRSKPRRREFPRSISNSSPKLSESFTTR